MVESKKSEAVVKLMSVSVTVIFCTILDVKAGFLLLKWVLEFTSY